ncbi:kinesin-like protein KIF25 [Megaptera novaeangliae]
MQAKEERIVELETENAFLHLKLAEYQEMTGKNSSEGAQVSPPPPGGAPGILRVPPPVHTVERAELKGNSRGHCRIRPLLPFDDESHDPVLQSSSQLQAPCLFHVPYILQVSSASIRSGPSLSDEEVVPGFLQRPPVKVSVEHRYDFVDRSSGSGKDVRAPSAVGDIVGVISGLHLLKQIPASNDGSMERQCLKEAISAAVPWSKAPITEPTSPSLLKPPVYGPAEPQNAVFEDVCPLLTSFLDGYNVCIMAYGQTGSGKSFTALGPHSKGEPAPQPEALGDSGVIPRAAGELFRLISEDPSRSPEVEVSIVEVYNNDICDLLPNDRCREASGAAGADSPGGEGGLWADLRCGGLVTLVAGSAAPGEAATTVPADFSRSHLLTTVPLPQPLPPRHRRAAVCPRSRTGLAPKEGWAGSAAEGALAIRARESGVGLWDGAGGASAGGRLRGAWGPSPVTCHSPAADPRSSRSSRSLPTELLCPVPQLPATGRRPSTSCRTASVSPSTQGLGRGSLGPAGHAEQVCAKLRPVDLVGSECAGVSGATGSALRETSCINRSLEALADVLGGFPALGVTAGPSSGFAVLLRSLSLFSVLSGPGWFVERGHHLPLRLGSQLLGVWYTQGVSGLWDCTAPARTPLLWAVHLAGHVEAGILVAGARDPTELEEVWATLGAVEASGCGFGDRGDLTTLALTSSSSEPMRGELDGGSVLHQAVCPGRQVPELSFSVRLSSRRPRPSSGRPPSRELGTGGAGWAPPASPTKFSNSSVACLSLGDSGHGRLVELLPWGINMGQGAGNTQGRGRNAGEGDRLLCLELQPVLG